jgi:hypothetical protein
MEALPREPLFLWLAHSLMEAIVQRKIWPALVLALTLSSTAAEARQRWDAAGTAGVFTSHVDASDAGGYVEHWDNTVQGAVVFGHYLSRQLKLELEASATTRGEQYRSIPVAIPDLPYPHFIFSEERTSVRSLSGTVAWQFGDNEWVHPFVLAGVSADWDDARVYVPQQSYRGDPRVASIPITDSRTESRTTQHVRGVFGGGAKLYFTERAFVRTDGRLTWGTDRQSLTFRAGIGIDF